MSHRRTSAIVLVVIALRCGSLAHAQVPDWVLYPDKEWKVLTPAEAGIRDLAAWDRWVEPASNLLEPPPPQRARRMSPLHHRVPIPNSSERGDTTRRPWPNTSGGPAGRARWPKAPSPGWWVPSWISR